jgi:hypothetical protein
MLSKPTTKPDFTTPFPKSSILSQLKSFLPMLKDSNEKILNDDELRKKMCIEVNEGRCCGL